MASDSTNLREKLKAEIMNGLWIDLKDHAERNAIFLVSQDLDLLDVAESVASDNVEIVSEWVRSGQLVRPTPAQTSTWEKESGKAFRFLILQPHILIQEQSH